MAIIENKVTAEGDVLVIKTDIPAVGIVALNQFVDTTNGETVDDYFKKEFRYSQDGGITFSSWIELNINNISGISLTKFDSFIIEYRYTRVGNTPDIILEFNDILVSGPIEELPFPFYKKTVFNKFFNVNDITVFDWALNVLEKIYKKGNILPNFYERDTNQEITDDVDFITYWNSITHFFSIIVNYARQFHDFGFNKLFLIEFLKSKDLSLPKDNNLYELIYIYNNYIEEYKKRGTLKITERRNSGLINDFVNHSLVKVDSEFIYFKQTSIDVFNKSDSTFWDLTIPIYNDDPYKWRITDFTDMFKDTYGTSLCKATLFFREYHESDIKSIFPILVYQEGLTSEQQLEINDYLDQDIFYFDINKFILRDVNSFYLSLMYPNSYLESSNIINNASEHYNIFDYNYIDGELIRLLGVNEFEEFLFVFFQNFENGWCISNSSPTWKGTEKIINIIKGYESTFGVESLTKYPLLNSQYISLKNSITLGEEGINGGKDFDLMSIEGMPINVLSGIDYDQNNLLKIPVDIDVDYEISFMVAQTVKLSNINFGCRFYDEAGVELLPNVINGTDLTNFYFQNAYLNVPNQAYWVRGILWNINKSTFESKTSLGIGYNLRFVEGVKYIVPIITVTGYDTENEVLFWNIKVRPLSLNFSRGQLGMHNLIYILAKNNNVDLNEDKINEFIREKLIPYNSFLKTNFINNE